MVPTGSGHATVEIMDIWPVAREAIEDGGAIRRRRSCPNCAQFVKEGKGAIKWTRLSCRSFAANAVRLQLRALAYNLGNFMRTLAMPQTAEPWSLKPAREADQHRHQGRQPWAVRYVSDGRSRGAAADVPGDPVADRRLRAPPAPA
jgi:Transposase DDE domain group 1